MKRSTFPTPERPPRQRPVIKPLAPRVPVVVQGRAGPVAAALGDVAVAERPAALGPRVPLHRSQAIRDSARGEACTVRLPGCSGIPDMTIWSHYRGSAGGKGGALKSSDHAGCYACTYCDAVYDGQRRRPAGWTVDMVALAWHEGHIRSLVRLHEKGLL